MRRIGSLTGSTLRSRAWRSIKKSTLRSGPVSCDAVLIPGPSRGDPASCAAPKALGCGAARVYTWPQLSRDPKLLQTARRSHLRAHRRPPTLPPCGSPIPGLRVLLRHGRTRHCVRARLRVGARRGCYIAPTAARARRSRGIGQLNNIEIAQRATMRRISDFASERLGIPEDTLEALAATRRKSRWSI